MSKTISKFLKRVEQIRFLVPVAVLTPFLMAPAPVATLHLVSFDQTSVVEQAQALLHDEYVENDGWQPWENPVGIQREFRNGRWLLTNDYDRVSVRIVAMVDGQVVGQVRLAGTIDGLYEVEHYEELPALLQGFKVGAGRSLLEVNRLVVKQELRSKRFKITGFDRERTLFQGLMQSAAMLAGHLRLHFIAAPKSELVKSTRRFDFRELFSEWKYDPSDPNTVQFVFRQAGAFQDFPFSVNCSPTALLNLHK